MTCCNKKCRFITSTDITVIDTQIVIQIPATTFNNGDDIYLLVAQDIPDAIGDNTVAIGIGAPKPFYPMIKRNGNDVRGDQIRRNTIYRLYVGTAPGHFLVKNSICLPYTSFIPGQLTAVPV